MFGEFILILKCFFQIWHTPTLRNYIGISKVNAAPSN